MVDILKLYPYKDIVDVSSVLDVRWSWIISHVKSLIKATYVRWYGSFSCYCYCTIISTIYWATIISTVPHGYLDGGPGEMCCLVITDNSGRVMSPAWYRRVSCCILSSPPRVSPPVSQCPDTRCGPACRAQLSCSLKMIVNQVGRSTVRGAVQYMVQYSTWCSVVLKMWYNDTVQLWHTMP